MYYNMKNHNKNTSFSKIIDEFGKNNAADFFKDFDLKPMSQNQIKKYTIKSKQPTI